MGLDFFFLLYLYILCLYSPLQTPLCRSLGSGLPFYIVKPGKLLYLALYLLCTFSFSLIFKFTVTKNLLAFRGTDVISSFDFEYRFISINITSKWAALQWVSFFQTHFITNASFPIMHSMFWVALTMKVCYF